MRCAHCRYDSDLCGRRRCGDLSGSRSLLAASALHCRCCSTKFSGKTEEKRRFFVSLSLLPGSAHTLFSLFFRFIVLGVRTMICEGARRGGRDLFQSSNLNCNLQPRNIGTFKCEVRLSAIQNQFFIFVHESLHTDI